MNEADSEIVLSIMNDNQYGITRSPEGADVILVNTCSVRDNAEQRVHQRLQTLKKYKRENPGVLIGVLGCMAERLRSELIEKGNVVDLVVGPDEYRKLPALVENAFHGQKGIAVQLSRVENYDDIQPLRTEGISAWLSVMRGCDKFCSFCVVPFTRGRERSRTLSGIVAEVERLSALGFKEVTLLGQNVNSYIDGTHDFADVLTAVARVNPALRVRFTTSHPQDMSGRLIRAMANHENVCNYIHLPVQSGSDRILEVMNRTYTSAYYLELVRKIREAIPDVSLSTDIIAGFPTETECDHQNTLALMNEIKYDGAFMFKYSPREHTKAWEMQDDVPDDMKIARLNEIVDLQQTISLERNQLLVGRQVEVLIERDSAKSNREWMGRTTTNKTVVFPKSQEAVGDLVRVTVNRCNSATLFGTIDADNYRLAVNQ
jgi:tRNA-2-methylthio-N6-dimethylallyladenosine synthase